MFLCPSRNQVGATMRYFLSFFILSNVLLFGGNLFENSGFESWGEKHPSPTAWRWRYPKGGREAFAIFEQAKGVAHSGNASLHLKDDDPGLLNHSLGYGLSREELAAARGKLLRFGGWIKQVSSQPARCVGLGIYLEMADGKRGGDAVWVNSATETDWERFQAKCMVPENCQLAVAFIHCASGFHNRGEAYFDDMWLTTDPEEIDPAADVITEVQVVPVSGLKDPVAVPAGGEVISFIDPLPPLWRFRQWGGFKLVNPIDTTPEVRLEVEKPIKAYGGLTFETKTLDRSFDCGHIPLEALKLQFTLTRNLPIQVAVGANETGAKYEIAPDPMQAEGGFRYEMPLATWCKGKPANRISSVSIQFRNDVSPGPLWIKDLCVVSDVETRSAGWHHSEELENYRESYRRPWSVTDDPRPRPAIKDGTWFMDGKPIFYVGPWIYGRTETNWNPGANPLNIEHIAYNEPPSKRVFDVVGFNTAHISSSHAFPGLAMYGLPNASGGPTQDQTRKS